MSMLQRIISLLVRLRLVCNNTSLLNSKSLNCLGGWCVTLRVTMHELKQQCILVEDLQCWQSAMTSLFEDVGSKRVTPSFICEYFIYPILTTYQYVMKIKCCRDIIYVHLTCAVSPSKWSGYYCHGYDLCYCRGIQRISNHQRTGDAN